MNQQEYVHEALLAALDEASAGLRDIETLARRGSGHDAKVALIAVAARAKEALGHVADIVDQLD